RLSFPEPGFPSRRDAADRHGHRSAGQFHAAAARRRSHQHLRDRYIGESGDGGVKASNSKLRRNSKSQVPVGGWLLGFGALELPAFGFLLTAVFSVAKVSARFNQDRNRSF